MANINKISKTNTDFLTGRLEIENWLQKHDLFNLCEVLSNKKYGFVVNARNNVSLVNLELDFIPVKFNKISGNFSIFGNKLTSLQFCPIDVEGSFCCAYNYLTSLEGAPKRVGANFDCYSNEIVTLEHGPAIIGGSYNCANNKLESLKFLPKKVGKEFYCNLNPQIEPFHKITNFEKLVEAVNIAKERSLIEKELSEINQIKKDNKI